MKRNLLIGFAALLMTVAATGANAQSKAQSKAEIKARAEQQQNEAVAKALENRVYTIRVTRVMPQGMRSYSLNGVGYSMTVNKDKVRSSLPYAGRLYQAPLSYDEGLWFFDTPVENYEMTDGKKDRKIITFDTETRTEKYSIRIEVFPNGAAMLRIFPQNRQNIAFEGELEYKIR